MSVMMAVTLSAVFISVALTTGSVVWLVLSRNVAERRRLTAMIQPPQGASVLLPGAVPLAMPSASDAWRRIARLLSLSKKEGDRLHGRLARAGLKSPSAPIVFRAIEVALPLAAGFGALTVAGSGRTAWLIAGAAALLAFFVPGLILERRIAARQREIQNGLPDALDLLVVCIEAGSGLDQAIMKTSDELAIAYPVLAEELRLVTTEIRAGKARLDAFKALAQRTKVEDIRTLVAMLIQTDRFGTSIGLALRTHADTSRVKRRQRAEEKAQKVGVKLVFPLVLCFFPAFYVVVLGPAVIEFIRVFMNK